MDITDINWLGVLIATIVYSAFSGTWHRQFAFGKIWEQAMGFDRPDGWKETNIYYIVPLIACFTSSLTIGILQTLLDISSLGSAALLGFLAGLGLATTTTFTNAVIPTMKRPLVFAAITGSAHAISLTLVSMVVYLV